MAINWGPYEGNMRVGIDIVWSSPNTGTSVNGTAKFYVQAANNFSFSDNQVLNCRAKASDNYTAISFFNGLSAGDQKLVWTKGFSASTNYAGSFTVTSRAHLTGHFAGATPANSRTTDVPARVPSPPDAPGTLGVSNIQATSIRITSNSVQDNGSPVTTYRFYYSTSGSWSESTPFQDNGGRVKDVTGLAPGTRYYFWVRAYNAYGRSGLSPRQTAVTLPVVNVYAAGAWRTAKCWVRAGGSWRPATVWVKADGTWRKTV